MARLCPAVLLIQQKIYLRNKCGFILLHSAISRNSLIHWILNLQVPANPQWLSIGRPSHGSEVDHPRPAQSSRDPSLDPSFWCCRFRVGGASAPVVPPVVPPVVTPPVPPVLSDYRTVSWVVLDASSIRKHFAAVFEAAGTCWTLFVHPFVYLLVYSLVYLLVYLLVQCSFMC